MEAGRAAVQPGEPVHPHFGGQAPVLYFEFLHHRPFPVGDGIPAGGAAADEIPQIFGPISGLYQLFIPYKNDEVNENGIPVQGGCSLVSKEQLSPALINKIDSWYPEKKNVQTADLSKNSDLRIVDEDGAQVWVT